MAIPLAVPIAMGLANIGSSIFGASRAKKAERRAAAQEARKRREMNRLKDVYSNIDTSNPYLNMENTMEDLTVNQQQFQLENQQGQQQRANILAQLRGSAGGSGVAALAQTLAQQGQLQAQSSAARIGQQEAANQQASAQQAANIQNLERQGEITSRQQQRDQAGTLLGMSQQEVAAARQQRAIAQQARMDAISGGISNMTSLAGSVFGAEAGTFSSGIFGDGGGANMSGPLQSGGGLSGQESKSQIDFLSNLGYSG